MAGSIQPLRKLFKSIRVCPYAVLPIGSLLRFPLCAVCSQASSGCLQNDYVTIPIYTGLGDTKNVIIAKTPDVIVALKGSYGTPCEIELALKAGTPLIGLDAWSEGFSGQIIHTRTVPETMTAIARLLTDR